MRPEVQIQAGARSLHGPQRELILHQDTAVSSAEHQRQVDTAAAPGRSRQNTTNQFARQFTAAGQMIDKALQPLPIQMIPENMTPAVNTSTKKVSAKVNWPGYHLNFSRSALLLDQSPPGMDLRWSNCLVA